MAHKKQRQLANKQPAKKKRHVAKILSGIICIVIGLYLNWDTAGPADVPNWIGKGPLIDIGTEEIRANISVRCNVMEGGIFVLNLSAGEQLDEPVRVWITVLDFYYPFHWEIRDDGTDNVILVHASDEESTSDYPIERTFISQKTDRMSGESIDFFSKWIYGEVFTTVIAPGEGTRKIKFQMEPEHTEYRSGGDVIIRMPYIVGARNMPVYDMSISDFYDIIESGDYNLLPYFSNYMIDGAALFESDLNISGDYSSEYIFHPNYVMTNIQPNPVQLFPFYFWRESLQWIPYIVFHDLGYDERSLTLSWISGILITIGSGLLVLPLSEWIQPMEKGKR